MKTLIVYYSGMGSTARIAGALVKATGATGRELVDIKKRTGIFSTALSALLGGTTTLRNPDYAVDSFDVVVLMTPIWAGNPTPAMNTFLKNADLTGKRALLGLVGAAEENPAAAEKLRKKISARGGQVTDVAYLKGIQPTGDANQLTEEQIGEEVEKLSPKLKG